jgi:hypothetical protein
VNARDNTPLRTLIADRLAAGEDTAAGIASAIGKGDTPSIVVKELNAMRTDGQVECEQRERGKKKGLVYWLAVPLAVAADDYEPEPAPVPATISEARAAQIYRVLPLYGAKPMTARQIAKATGATIGLISPTLSGMVKAGQISRVLADPCDAYGYTRLPPAGGDIDIQNAQPEVAKNTGSSASGSLSPSEGAAATPSAAPVAADEPQDDDAMPPADAALLALANRELADRLARVAHVLRGSGLEGLKDLDDGADLQTAAAALTGAYQMTLANLQARGEQFLEMQDELNKRDDELLKQAALVVNLRSSIETMQREAMRGASLMSGQDRYTATGYLVRASKRKPRTLLDKDKARDAALSSIRAGAQRAEVFALVPIGHARRGAEWMSA